MWPVLGALSTSRSLGRVVVFLGLEGRNYTPEVLPLRCQRKRLYRVQAGRQLIHSSNHPDRLVCQSRLVNTMGSPQKWQCLLVLCQILQKCLRQPAPVELGTFSSRLYVSAKIVSANQRRKDSLSLNCLNSSVSSLSTAVITRANALSCSIRAF